MKSLRREISIFVALVAIAVTWNLVGCSKKAATDTEDKVLKSRYIMIDDSCCVHTPGCIIVRYKANVRVRYVDTVNVYKEDLEWFCPTCIGVREYEHLMRLKEVKL